MVEVTCQCGTRLRLGDEWAGSRGKCPRCGGVLEVPALPAGASTTPASLPRGAAQVPTPPPLPRAPAASASVAIPPPAPARYGAPAAPSAPLPSRDDTAANDVLKKRLLLGGVAAAAAVLGMGLFVLILRGGGDEPELRDTAVASSASTSDATPLAHNAPSGGNSDTEANTATPRPPVQPDQRPQDNTAPKPAPPAVSTSAASAVASPASASPRVSQGNPTTLDAAPTATVGATQGPTPSRPRGLSGLSQKYDDFQCRRIQETFGTLIPAGATVLEVDGDRLPITNVQQLQAGLAPFLFLPKGEHAVQFATGERPISVTVADHLGDTYQDMRTFFGLPDGIRSDELFSRGARAMDVHSAPFLLNFLGGWYAGQGQWAAAERKFRRSVRVNPAFAPAHLNLAHCLARRQDQEGAARELRLAQAFNIGNVFGLNAGVVALRRQLDLPLEEREPVAFLADLYIASEPLTVEDERLTALMLALSKYAVRDEDRGKVLNNLAVHFADSDKPETALEYFRTSLAALKNAGPERFALARQVLSHMDAACRRAGFEEADEYRHMQQAVRP